MIDTLHTQPRFTDADKSFFRFQSQGNVFSVSSLNEFYSRVDSSDFAIKYVTSGVERYRVNQQEYMVKPGSYLLLNGEKEADVEIPAKQNVKGICVNLSASLIAETVASIRQPDTAYSDIALANFFYTDHFLENQYDSTETSLGKAIGHISNDLLKNNFTRESINDEMFFSLAERLVIDQLGVFKQLSSIPAVRIPTQKDLYRRVLRGRDYINEHFTEQLTIESVAREAAMSQFHFFRLFRKVFGQSPYQYILRKRLTHARELLSREYSVSQTAIECGFSDIYSFSKAFKQEFGCPPSTITHHR